MSDIKFHVDDAIYQNRTALKDSADPVEIIGREEELEALRNALQPVVMGDEPDNVFVYGKSGTGKTACARHITTKMEEACEETGVPVATIWENCTGKTIYRVWTNLVNNLRQLNGKELIPQTGLAEGSLHEMFFEEVADYGGTVLLCLDEINRLPNDSLNEFFYLTSRASSNNDLNGAYVGTVCISGKMTLLEQLDADVRSTLCKVPIQFDPYNSPALERIIAGRVNTAFFENAIDDVVIRAAAAIGAKNGGDARKALDIIRNAGDLARNRGADRVTEKLVQEAHEKMRENRTSEAVRGLSTNERCTMYALATLVAEGNESPRTKEIYARYEGISATTSPVSYRQVRDYLADFDRLDLTDTTDRKSGGMRGNHKRHQLNPNFDLEAVVAALESTIADCGVYPSIEKYVNND